MPAQPNWYSLLPGILARLDSPDAPPFLDRPAFEQLFGVGRRQAIRLMGSAEGYQVGKTFLVDRSALVRFLKTIQQSGAVAQECTRKRRVAAALNEAHQLATAQKVHVHTPAGVLQRQPSDLPATIDLVEPGRIQINYRGAEDLLSQLVELAASAANDFSAFRRRFEEIR